jgi:NAD+ diphosphatase
VGLSGERPQLTDPSVDFQDLRMLAGALPPEEAGLLAYARAMIHWRETHRFCGRCGSPTRPSDGGHVLRCSNEACRSHQFPRIDPAVIVLVTDGERALLGRQAAWPPGRYSTIAGFVEPGESLEDAVAREVREETGVEVGAVDYHSSQPWPFPSSLMLGFTAYATRTDISRVDDELEDVRWWTRAEIAGGAVALPITHSISFRLVEDWYDSGADRPLRAEPGVRMWQVPRR